MIDLQISNFRKIASASVVDSEKVSLLLGYNEAGKSSVAGAVEFAFTGSAFGFKGGSISELVRKGADRMKVALRVGDFTVSRTQSGGPSLKEISQNIGVSSEMLPLLFNMFSCAKSGGKLLLSFFESMADAPLDPSEIFKNDSGVIDSCGDIFEQNLPLKKTVSLLSNRRASFKPKTLPLKPLDAVVDDSLIQKMREELSGLIASKAQKESILQKIQLCERAIKFFEACEKYEAKARDSKKDALGERRVFLQKVTELKTTSFNGLTDSLKSAGLEKYCENIEKAISSLSDAIKEASDIIKKNPPAADIGKRPVMSDELSDFCSSNKISDTSSASSVLLEARNELSKITEQSDKCDSLQESIDSAIKTNSQWDSYNKNYSIIEAENKDAEEKWNIADTAIKRIEELSLKRRIESSKVFFNHANNIAEHFLNGRKFSMTDDGEFLMDDAPIQSLSASAQWRAYAAITAAVGKFANSPVLILDGADILDAQNRASFLRFVVEGIAPHFVHVIVTSTLKGLESDEAPSKVAGVTKWIITDGFVRPI